MAKLEKNRKNTAKKLKSADQIPSAAARDMSAAAAAPARRRSLLETPLSKTLYANDALSHDTKNNRSSIRTTNEESVTEVLPSYNVSRFLIFECTIPRIVMNNSFRKRPVICLAPHPYICKEYTS